MPPALAPVPPAERDVLACLHHHKEATARQLREALHRYRPMTHGAIVVLLKRLEAKKLVGKEKGPVGKAFVYYPTRPSRSAFTGLVRDLVQRVFHGDPISLVASLFETQAPTAEQVERLQELLRDLRRKGNQRKGGRS